MFNAKVKSDILKALIDVTSPLVNEAKFNISKDGISLRAVDPAHVAMVELELTKTAFDNKLEAAPKPNSCRPTFTPSNP